MIFVRILLRWIFFFAYWMNELILRVTSSTFKFQSLIFLEPPLRRAGTSPPSLCFQFPPCHATRCATVLYVVMTHLQKPESLQITYVPLYPSTVSHISPFWSLVKSSWKIFPQLSYFGWVCTFLTKKEKKKKTVVFV